MDKTSISLVFPAYNEADNLKSLTENAYKSASNITDDFEIIIVDDGSTDDTKQIIASIKPNFGSKLRPIHIWPNRGYANALRTGFNGSQKRFIFYSDSDNQFDLNDITLLLGKIEGNDMVIGFRKDRQDNFLRIFISKCYNLLIRTFFGLKVKDIDCAFKLFRKEIFKKIKINHEKWLIDTEILLKAHRFGMKIAQVGVKHLPRAGGRSTVKPKDIIFTLKGLFRLRKELKSIKD